MSSVSQPIRVVAESVGITHRSSTDLVMVRPNKKQIVMGNPEKIRFVTAN